VTLAFRTPLLAETISARRRWPRIVFTSICLGAILASDTENVVLIQRSIAQMRPGHYGYPRAVSGRRIGLVLTVNWEKCR
jgi:hypothetical protein